MNKPSKTPKQLLSVPSDFGLFKYEQVLNERAPGETLVMFGWFPTQLKEKVVVRLKYSPGGGSLLSRWLLTGPGPELRIVDFQEWQLSTTRGVRFVSWVETKTPRQLDLGPDSVLDGSMWSVAIVKDGQRRDCGALSPLYERRGVTAMQQTARYKLVAVGLGFLEQSRLRFYRIALH